MLETNPHTKLRSNRNSDCQIVPAYCGRQYQRKVIVLLGRHGLIGETVYKLTGWTVSLTWQRTVIAIKVTLNLS